MCPVPSFQALCPQFEWPWPLNSSVHLIGGWSDSFWACLPWAAPRIPSRQSSPRVSVSLRGDCPAPPASQFVWAGWGSRTIVSVGGSTSPCSLNLCLYCDKWVRVPLWTVESPQCFLGWGADLKAIFLPFHLLMWIASFPCLILGILNV